MGLKGGEYRCIACDHKLNKVCDRNRLDDWQHAGLSLGRYVPCYMSLQSIPIANISVGWTLSQGYT